MTKQALQLVPELGRPVVSEIEHEEHQQILNSLCRVEERQVEGATVHAGLNTAGRLVVLLTTLTGFAVISAPT